MESHIIETRKFFYVVETRGDHQDSWLESVPLGTPLLAMGVMPGDIIVDCVEVVVRETYEYNNKSWLLSAISARCKTNWAFTVDPYGYPESAHVLELLWPTLLGEEIFEGWHYARVNKVPKKIRSKKEYFY